MNNVDNRESEGLFQSLVCELADDFDWEEAEPWFAEQRRLLAFIDHFNPPDDWLPQFTELD